MVHIYFVPHTTDIQLHESFQQLLLRLAGLPFWPFSLLLIVPFPLYDDKKNYEFFPTTNVTQAVCVVLTCVLL